MNVTLLTKNSIVVPIILSAIVFITLYAAYKMNKIDTTKYNPLNITLITSAVFIISWFIMDTVIENKKIKNSMYSNIVKNNREYLEQTNDSNNKTLNEDYVEKGFKQKIKQNKYNNDTINYNSVNDANINNNSIKHILEEPLISNPEYKYMTKNNVQIPDDVELYLDRGKI